MREDFHPSCELETAHDRALLGKALQMLVLLEIFQALVDAVDSFAYSHRNQAVRLRILWQAVPPEIGHEKAYVCPHRTETASLLAVRKVFQPIVESYHPL